MLVSTVVAQADPNVRQGYRLYVSNLEDLAFSFAVRYWRSTREPRWESLATSAFSGSCGFRP